MGLLGFSDEGDRKCDAVGCTSSAIFVLWCIECESSCDICESCGYDPAGFWTLALLCEKWQCASDSPTHEHASIVLKRDGTKRRINVPEGTPYGVKNAISELKDWYKKVITKDPTILDRLDDGLVLEQNE